MYAVVRWYSWSGRGRGAAVLKFRDFHISFSPDCFMSSIRGDGVAFKLQYMPLMIIANCNLLFLGVMCRNAVCLLQRHLIPCSLSQM